MKLNAIAAGIAAALISVSASSLAHAQPDLGGGAAAPAPGAPPAAAVPRGPIEIVVWNIRKGLGHVRVAICTQLTFANSHRTCPYHGDAVAHVGVTTVVVPDVPAGAYAAQVYQDEPDINTLRRNPLGIPMEGVGFSNDAEILLTGPRFKDASFDHDPASPLSLRIKLRYFPNL